MNDSTSASETGAVAAKKALFTAVGQSSKRYRMICHVPSYRCSRIDVLTYISLNDFVFRDLSITFTLP